MKRDTLNRTDALDKSYREYITLVNCEESKHEFHEDMSNDQTIKLSTANKALTVAPTFAGTSTITSPTIAVTFGQTSPTTAPQPTCSECRLQLHS